MQNLFSAQNVHLLTCIILLLCIIEGEVCSHMLTCEGMENHRFGTIATYTPKGKENLQLISAFCSLQVTLHALVEVYTENISEDSDAEQLLI